MKTKSTLLCSVLLSATALLAYAGNKELPPRDTAATPSSAPAATPRAGANDLSSSLRQGLFEEEANRNLPAAISAYEAVAKQFDKDRALAATAVFRLGECYRKQGQTNEAAAQYERILRDFADQQQLVTLSRQNLAGLGAKQAAPAAQLLSRLALQQQASLLEEQIKLAEQDVAEAKKQFESGVVSQADVRAKERAVLSLRQQLAALDLDSAPEARGADSVGTAADQANLLAAQLAGIEKLKGDPEQQARAALALYPDEDLKKMLLHLPKLQAQEAKLKADPNAKLDGFTIALSPGREVFWSAGADANLANAQAQLSEQLNLIRQRVDFILGLQRARLEVLQSVAGTAEVRGATKPGATAVVIDEEETEIRRLQKMIQNSPDLINAPSGGPDDNFTPLGRAASKGQLRVAQFLLDSGAEVNRAYQGKTPLLLAAGRGHKAMVELLLVKGADINARDNNNSRTALHIAAENGFQATAEVLVARNADVNARSTKQETPLQAAATAGHAAMVKFLLSKGADADAKGPSGMTALMVAAARGHSETMQTLLSAGAKPDLEDDSGRTALSYAAERGHLGTVKVLLAAKADPNAGKILPLHLAIFAKATDVVEELLEAGADANRLEKLKLESNFQALTPLYLAIQQGNAEPVKLLLAHKADPNGLGPDRLPVILRATGQPRVLEALLQAGAKPNVDDGEGRTPLISAVADGVAESVRILLTHGADKEVRPSGFTPLLIAVERGDQKSAEFLLQAGAEVNARTAREGRTALHLAVLRKDPGLTALLLTNKADVNARDASGHTPLDYAKGNSAGPRPGSGGALRMPPQPMVPGGFSVSLDTTSAPAAASPTSITDLLREHGALDELPDFTTIRVNRQGLEQPIEVFRRQTNDWNRFTLLETVLGLYAKEGLVDFQRGYGALAGQNLNPEPSFQSRLQSIIANAGGATSKLWFPDLKRIIVHRPSRTPGGKEQAIAVNLLNATNGVDCAKNLPLEFGDVVEIPVRDHTLSESPSALSVAETAGILHCLRRKVRLTVRGQSREFELRPTWAECYLCGALGKPEAKSQLLSSSDLSRVKVTRKDPAGGQAQAFVLDLGKPVVNYDDLWLHDGDVIEVPEKTTSMFDGDPERARAGGKVLLFGGVKTQFVSWPIGQTMSLVEAILKAGTTKLANPKKVQLVRTDSRTQAQESRVIDLSAALKGGSSGDILLLDGDRVTVPEILY